MEIDHEEKEFQALVENGAYMCSGVSNQELIENLQRTHLIDCVRVKEAMLAIDRKDFAPSTPYEDYPVAIGYGATISAPHMHAAVLSRLKNYLTEGKTVLDVGSGSGYLTACMSIMIGKTGKVVGIEHVGGLVDTSLKNIERNHADLLTSGRILIVEGDGRKGYKDEAPYDAIHVGAAAPRLPLMLIDQLATNGRMIVPIESETGEQILYEIDKDDNGDLLKKALFSVLFVPLTDLPHAYE